jgi:hypothetical protein
MKTILLSASLVLLGFDAMAGGRLSNEQPATNQPPLFTSADAVQAEFLKRFLNARGFGMSRVILPEFHQPASELLLSGRRFSVKAPELIGLEEHPEPVAYQLPMGSFLKADLTNKVLKSQVKLRELNDFESRALARLRRGENVVMELDSSKTPNETGNRQMRLVAMGAIRATKDCLDCHSGREGKLLGAFSYVLTRAEDKVANPKVSSVPEPSSAKLAAGSGRPLR